MYCPNCKRYYKKGIELCSYCKIKLVEQLPNELDEENEVIKINAPDNYNTDIIIDLLTKNGIPCYTKSKGAGGYLNINMGFSVYGTDIYISKKDHPKAAALLNSLIENQLPAIKEDSRIKNQIAFYKNPRIIAQIILIAFAIIVILSFIVNLV